MNTDNIKNQMMKLWKDTFHDSDDYIKLIFDSYFNPDYIAYRIKDDKIISALLGVPYSFKSKINPDVSLRGLYLCGLATNPNQRGNGIMSELIEEINKRAADLKFDFTFLIPANEGLFKYYSDRGYSESVFRIKNEYFSTHDFKNEYITKLISHSHDRKLESGTIINQKEVEKQFHRELNYYDTIRVLKIKNPDSRILRLISNYISKFESSQHFLMLNHSPEDVAIAIDENEISEGSIIIAINQKGEIIGISFLAIGDDDDITVQYYLYDDIAVKFKMLSEIKNLDILPILSSENMTIISSSNPDNIKRTESDNQDRDCTINEKSDAKNNPIGKYIIQKLGINSSVENENVNKGGLSKSDRGDLSKFTGDEFDNSKGDIALKEGDNHQQQEIHSQIKESWSHQSLDSESTETIQHGNVSTETDYSSNISGIKVSEEDLIDNAYATQSKGLLNSPSSNDDSETNQEDEKRHPDQQGLENFEASYTDNLGSVYAEICQDYPAAKRVEDGDSVSKAGRRRVDKDFLIHCYDNPFTTEVRAALWSTLYIGGDDRFSALSSVAAVEAPLTIASREHCYTMIRLLNPCDILKLCPSDGERIKYPILVEDLNGNKEIKIVTNSGDYIVNCQITNQNHTNYGYLQEDGIVKITLKELSDILFRRPGSSKIADEALGLPKIPLFIGLMLD